MARGHILSVAALAAAGLTGISAAWADTETATFADVDTIELRDFIATVVIVADDVDETSISIDNGDAGKEPVRVRKTGDSIEVYSDEEPDQKAFWKKMNWHRHGDDTFKVFLEDHPVVEITMPRGTRVEIDGLASHLTVGNTDGDFTVASTLYVEGTVGNVRAADIRITGAGELDFASVSESLEAKIAGSGALSFNMVQSADIGIAGSGDIDITEVAGPLSADIRGSGDITVGKIAGQSEFRIAGSGDIEAGKISNGADISIRGSGDVVVSEINGPSAVSITGNGDVEIKNGRAEDFKVKITGSGDLEFNGIATNPDIRLSGSGDVFIKDYEGNLTMKGNSGDITIGDVRIDN